MGITIHYRGKIDRLQDVEELEDRVTDIAFSLGGHATIWRSFADHDPKRLVRGLIVEMAPGQDSLSLLISPEGYFIPLHEIEAAEKGPFAEPPYCFVKTQLGGVEGHVAVSHLLAAIKARYCSQLVINDESGYYENRNTIELAGKMGFLDGAIGMLANQLRQSGLSKEAAEDPGIVASRVERIAMLVHQKMGGTSKPMLATDDSGSDSDWMEPSLEDKVGEMDRLRRYSDLRNERMARWIEEGVASGMSDGDAFDLAMQKEGFETRTDAENDEVEEQVFDIDDNSDLECDEKHPSVVEAEALLIECMALPMDETSSSSFPSIACRGAMDMVGGLVQATRVNFDDRIDRALAISQLKRALSGHAFAQGAVFGLCSEGTITAEKSTQLHDQLQSILKSIHALSHDAWNEPDFD